MTRIDEESPEELIARVNRDHATMLESMSGHSRLWHWFGLSRASFLVLPRSMMHEMPDEWQLKMAKLLEEWGEAWDWPEDFPDSNNVVARNKNRFVKWPDWVVRYRHPDSRFLRSLMVKQQENA